MSKSNHSGKFEFLTNRALCKFTLLFFLQPSELLKEITQEDEADGIKCLFRATRGRLK